MVTAILANLARSLEAQRLPYMVVGGQAVLLYGEPRVTRDIDVTLGVDLERLPDLLSVVRGQGWRVLVEKPEAFVARHLVLPCEDATGGMRFDFVFGLTPYEREAVERARKVMLEGKEVRYITPEDLILHKLFAGRPRDLEDVAGILRRRHHLDLEYVRRWLQTFDRGSERTMAAQFERMLEAAPTGSCD